MNETVKAHIALLKNKIANCEAKDVFYFEHRLAEYIRGLRDGGMISYPEWYEMDEEIFDFAMARFGK